jgi:hypothetical protein
VNKFRTGCFCAALWLACLASGRAQEQPSQTTPPQAPVPSPTTPPSGPVIQQPPPLPPKVPDVRMPGETGWFAGVNAWFPTQQPVFNKGRASDFASGSRVTLAGKPNLAEGIEIGFAVGAHNTMRLSMFQARASGDTVIPNELTLIGQTYPAGTLLATDYRLQNAKLSFEFLTWPYPVESRRFRLKTLWQVQYTSFSTGFDAPLIALTDESGNRLVDASGTPISYARRRPSWFVLPSVGLNATEYVSRHFRLEASASGFTIPRHNTIWDADASANVRLGRIELRVGAKAFHFKSSTAQAYYGRGTLSSAFVGIRWYSE